MVTCEECGDDELYSDGAIWNRSYQGACSILCGPCYAATGLFGDGPQGDRAAEMLADSFKEGIEMSRRRGWKMSTIHAKYAELAARIEARAIASYEARLEGISEER